MYRKILFFKTTLKILINHYLRVKTSGVGWLKFKHYIVFHGGI